MKYSSEIIINLPRKRVIELFDSIENMYKWQEGLESFEHISGEAGEVGAKSKLIFNLNGKKMEMIESITHKNLPAEFFGTYEMDNVFNAINNYFDDLNGVQTRWRSETEFKFTKGPMKYIAFLLKFVFKQHSMKLMSNFKNFAEAEGFNEDDGPDESEDFTTSSPIQRN